MVVISDCSVITNLFKIDRLGLLFDVFNEIIIPSSVYKELSVLSRQKKIIDSLDWIKTVEVKGIEDVSNLLSDLDIGEAEAIILAKELSADLLLIDEKRGRKLARQHGIKITGLLGLLIRAKKNGFITNVKDPLDDLINNARFFVNPKLYKEVLRQVDEI